MRWFARSNSSFGARPFIHKTRCHDSTSGATIRAQVGSGATYKKCRQSNTNIAKAFNVAPFLCE
jgi:hypothetical protein